MIFLVAALALVLLFAGIRVVRPTHRGLVVVFGKYRRFAEPGLHWILPVVMRMLKINSTEQMVDAEPQECITNDNLDAYGDAQVCFRARPDEESVKVSQYKARTTLRKETRSRGISIVRTRLKEIDPPKDVQETMSKVVKAENEKIAAIDFATATETMADGQERAEKKKAEGVRQAEILKANAKVVPPADRELFTVIGGLVGVFPRLTGSPSLERAPSRRALSTGFEAPPRLLLDYAY